MSELPKGWSKVCIADVVDKPKQNKPEADENIIYVDIGSINREKKVIENPQQLLGADAPSRARKRINTDDVLVSLTRPSLNAVAIVPEYLDQQYASTGFDVLKPNSIHPKFLFYLVRTRKFIDAISGKVQGALYPAAKSSDVQSFEFHAPNLEEQKRIADKLDSVLARVEAAQARLDKIPAILKRFRQSVLAAATSGELTKEWREENLVVEPASELKVRWLAQRKLSFETNQSKLVGEGRIKRAKKFKQPVQADTQTVKLKEDQKLPVTWEVVSVSEFADCLDNQRIPVKKENRLAAKGLYPYFGANGEVDKVDDFIFDDDLVMVTEDETFYGREKPIAFRYSGKCWVNNHAHVLRAPNEVGNKFLCYSLMYYHVIPWLTGTTGRAKLTQAALNSLPVNMPPELEQAEIVRRVEDLLCKADVLERQFLVAKAKVAKLTQALLTKAFKGELLPSSVDSHIEAIESSIEALNA